MKHKYDNVRTLTVALRNVNKQTKISFFHQFIGHTSRTFSDFDKKKKLILKKLIFEFHESEYYKILGKLIYKILKNFNVLKVSFERFIF